MAYVVAANQGASLQKLRPPSPGRCGSMVVDFDGRIMAQADPGPGEKIVVAEIDLEALRAARKRRLGHNPLAHLRAEAYGRKGMPGLSRWKLQGRQGFVPAIAPWKENESIIRSILNRQPYDNSPHLMYGKSNCLHISELQRHSHDDAAQDIVELEIMTRAARVLVVALHARRQCRPVRIDRGEIVSPP